MDDLGASNVTRANITGKVPQSVKRPRRGGSRKAKPARLSGDHRKHAGALAKRGMISPQAAASHGLTGAK
jgi:hypothetical protein